MSGLAAARAKLAQVKRDNAEFFLPLRLAWSDGVMRAFKVTDPNRLSTTGPTQLQTTPIPASLRLVKFGPDDALPLPGVSVLGPEGLLVLGMFTDAGNLFGTRVGVCRLVDARAYPTPAALTDGSPLRLRIIALDAAGLSTGTNDLVAVADNSHRGHLPPGIHLQVGNVLVTSDGDQYAVTAPLQRDLLGDTVGLSWQRGGQVPPTPGNGDGSGGGGTSPNPDDSYWKVPVL